MQAVVEISKNNCDFSQEGDIVKKFFLLIIISTFALLSACGSRAAQAEGVQATSTLNEKFISWFRPTPEELAQLEGGIYDVDIRSTHEYETIYLRQIIGSLHALYFALDVSGETEINHVEILTDASQEGWRASTATGNIMLYPLPAQGGYIIRFFPEPSLHEGQEIVIQLETNNTIHEISVIPNVFAPVNITPIFHANGEQVGQIVISAVHMHIEFTDIDDEFADSDTLPPVNVNLKNGENVRPRVAFSRTQPQNINVRGAGIFLSEDKTSPRKFFSWFERQNLWILDEVTAVEFDDIEMFSFSLQD